MNPMFKKIILLGRPASGKSEFIDFIKNTPADIRLERYHIGEFEELDDFLWLWEKFNEDDIWEAAGHSRLYSKRVDPAYVLTDGVLLDFCLERFNGAIKKTPENKTIFVEFSRGAGDGGYAHALERLSDDVLRDAAVLFIWNTYEESCRRNEARYREKLKHTVLAHKVPDEDMERFGKEIDWENLTKGEKSGFLNVRDLRLPFVTMNNMPEITDKTELDRRYKKALDQLMELNLSMKQPV